MIDDNTVMLAAVILLALFVALILALPTGAKGRAAGRARFSRWQDWRAGEPDPASHRYDDWNEGGSDRYFADRERCGDEPKLGKGR